MSDEDALLAAICADPADDTVRLAFADLLDERGGEVETAWARFIRAHLRLGTGTEMPGDIPTVMELGADAWTDRLAARLGLPPRDGVSVGEWERGLPSSLLGPYPALRERWDALLVRAPFRQLSVLDVGDGAVEDLVLWPRLERLTALGLATRDDRGLGATSSGAMTERGVAAVAACPALAGLESLTLIDLDLTERAADLILNSRPLRRLRELHVWTAAAWTEQSHRAAARLEARFGRVLLNYPE